MVEESGKGCRDIGTVRHPDWGKEIAGNWQKTGVIEVILGRPYSYFKEKDFGRRVGMYSVPTVSKFEKCNDLSTRCTKLPLCLSACVNNEYRSQDEVPQSGGA